MADKNFNQNNQSNQSNEDWEKDRNRFNRENDWSSQSGGDTNDDSQYRRRSQGFRDVGYSGDSARGMGSGNDDYNRINYMPDNDDNRKIAAI